jgi:glycosyltransferase involved in cell wall biosynthesis
MRASIIINNYNYARFLGQAVESALNQTHPNTEVVVVDDGSTDNSLKILESYGNRITLIAKENGGQASCYSAGLSQCSGELVLFLDADDYLRPECIERVLQHWTPTVSKAHFYLAVVDADAKPLWRVVPAGRLADGEALKMMRLFGCYSAPPASGNVFSSAFLKEIFPIRNERELIYGADTIPIFAAPYFGQIVSVREILGFYRRHASAGTYFDPKSVLASLRSEHDRDMIRDRAWRINSQSFENAAYHLLDPSRAKRSVCYLRLSGGTGIAENDTCVSLLNRSVNGIWHWSGYTFRQRLIVTIWFFLVTFLPMLFAKPLIRVALGLGKRTRWQHRLWNETLAEERSL